MRRKKLIVVALIAVMLLTSFLPLIGYAADEGEEPTTAELTFNTPMYKALKSYFKEKDIEAKYDDINHVIRMDTDVINGIEELSLKEKGITDISGIETFANVKSLILSANNLSEKSNLGVLNGLDKLNYLDLSSNNIGDISEIEPLVVSMLRRDSNAVNLSSQVVTSVVDIELNEKEEKISSTQILPQILSIAGIVRNGAIDNKGYLKADWFKEYNVASSLATKFPRIDQISVPNPVTNDAREFDILVGEERLGTYTPYQGLVKLVVRIEDRNNGAYNPNPSAENVLKDSIFTLFYVVHTDVTDAVIIKDNRLFTAIEEQLRKDQTINTELLSYRYGTTHSGELAYDLCDYRVTAGTATATLSLNGTDIYSLAGFSGTSGEGFITDLRVPGYVPVKVAYEVITDEIIDASGNITYKRRVKVPHLNAECRDLYVDAYFEPQVFVIYDLDIVNKITSLILNDQQICDLYGIDKFVGLESNLNVSFNYIDTLAYIYALEMNKESRNESLRTLYNEKKIAMSSVKQKITKAYNQAVNVQKSIKEQIKKIKEQEAIIATITDPTSTEYTNAIKAIQAAIKAIYGDASNPDDNGLLGEMETALKDPQDGLNSNLAGLYPRLAAMYRVFNKEYKLTSFTTPDLNYQTEEEYLAYLDKSSTKAGAQALAKAQANRIATLEKSGALTDLEKDLLQQAFGLSLSGDQEYKYSYALNELVKDYTDLDVGRTTWVRMNQLFMEIAIYSGAANYCLIERMNKDVGTTACFVSDYLYEVYENYEYEGIDSTLIEAIYKKAKDNIGSTEYTTELNDIFTDYIKGKLTYGGTDFFKCEGPYYDVVEVNFGYTTATSPAGDYPDVTYFKEKMEGGKESDRGTFFYTQLMTLANKFTAFDETARYITLPPLKRIDIRNNQIESLGTTILTRIAPDGTEEEVECTLASLTRLKELFAGHNIVTGDISCVDWTTLTALKKLDLSYNFIRDISALQVLTNLRYLDVSDNLLEGAFNLSLKRMEKLEKINLAGNQYSDIQKIINDYEISAGGDPTRYFAREDTLDLDLSRQSLEITFKDPIAFVPGVTVQEIELPPIFAQLEYIDAIRTAFGTTSSKGSIRASGGVAYIPVYEVGDYQAEVTVIAKNGYPEDVTTSMGIGSKCTINYSVRRMGVTGIAIVEDEVTQVVKGSTQKFTARVDGDNVQDTRVIWSVEGNTSTGTGISETGLLVIGANETADHLTIKATSAIDNTKEAVKVVEVVEPELEKVVTSVTVAAQSAEVEPGKAVALTATVDGSNLKDADKTVTWKVTGNTSVNTQINAQGVLTVGANETSGTLIVTATSNLDKSRSGSLALTVKLPEGQEPDTPNPSQPDPGNNPSNPPQPTTYGYATSSDGTELVGISPETAITAFATKLTKGQAGYNVEVKRNGTTLASTEYVGTGDIVVIKKDGATADTFELVVKGDVNGDGVADAEDSALIKSHRAKLTELTGSFLTAADIDSDGEITVTDLRLLLYHRAKIDGYIL